MIRLFCSFRGLFCLVLTSRIIFFFLFFTFEKFAKFLLQNKRGKKGDNSEHPNIFRENLR